jgi:hypothetical protein
MSAQFRRRRKVEIYFVLYLAALVLLMPDSRDALLGTGGGADRVRLDLQPERLDWCVVLQRIQRGRLV